MIPYDSFLIDPFLLMGTGIIGNRLGRRITASEEGMKKWRWGLGALVIAIFHITSIGLYFNAGWTKWIADMCGAESGRDWMINSGVFSFEHENPSTKTHLLAALLFLTYPVWLAIGYKLGEIGSKE